MRFARWIILSALLLCLSFSTSGRGQVKSGGKRLPVPDAKSRAAAGKLIKDLYKADFAKRAAADRAALGAKLLAQANAAEDEPAVRFVLFEEARDMLAAAGEVREAFEAIDAAARQFGVDAVAAKLTVLGTAVRAPRDAADITRLALDVMDDGAAAGRFAHAGKAAAIAKAVSSKLKDKDLAKRVRSRAADLPKWQQEHKAASAAEATLKADPEDPAANLAVGSYRCFRRGDWAVGLPLLAKGSDDALATLVRQDLGGADDGKSAVAVADGWWDYGAGETAARRAGARARAAYWYEKALPDLTGLKKSAAETRLANLKLPPDGWTVKPAKYSQEISDRLLDAADVTIPDEGKLQSDDHRIHIAGTKKSGSSITSGRPIHHYGEAALIEGVCSAAGTIEVGYPDAFDHTGYVIGVVDDARRGQFMDVPLHDKIVYRWSVAEADDRVVMTVTKDGTEVGSVSIPSDEFNGFAFGTWLRYAGDKCDLRVTLDKPEE